MKRVAPLPPLIQRELDAVPESARIEREKPSPSPSAAVLSTPIKKQDSLIADLLGLGRGIFGSPSLAASDKKKKALAPVIKVAPTPSKSSKGGAQRACKYPRRIFTEGWDRLPPCAVIVTVRGNGSYDRLFRDVPQRSPDDAHSVALFETDFESLADFHAYWATEDCRSEERGAHAQTHTYAHASTELQQVLEAVRQVRPDSVLFNFECCAFCARKDFANVSRDLMLCVRAIVQRGYMAMFSDFSLKALISHWDVALLGPCPLHHIGKCEGRIELAFDCEKLQRCASAQLRHVGEMCDQRTSCYSTPAPSSSSSSLGQATIKCMGNNIIFSLQEPRQYEHAPFDVEVLSIATDFGKFWTLDPQQHRMRRLFVHDRVGYAGHVMLTYKQGGGRILASACHWQDLLNVEAKPENVLNAVQRVYGRDYAQEIEREIKTHESSQENVQEIVQRSVRQIVLSSAPCSYSLRNNIHPSAPLSPLPQGERERVSQRQRQRREVPLSVHTLESIESLKPLMSPQTSAQLTECESERDLLQ